MHGKSTGHIGPKFKNQKLDHVRPVIVQMWNAKSAKKIGFAPSVADGIFMIVESMHWGGGDNVIVDADDIPSLIAPFAIKIRYTGVDFLESVADSKTRLIAVSHVSYLNSARLDLAHYRRLSDKPGAILIVNYSQAAGYAPIDASIADFAFSCCHKWLLGSTGVTIVYWNQTRQPGWRPSTAGWHLRDPLPTRREQWEMKTLGLRDDALIEMHVQALTTSLLRALERDGIPSSTPREKEGHGASVIVPCNGAAEIVNKMRELGVYAWNGDGKADIEQIMNVFSRLWRKYND
ncbi:pyridoxal phosphate-dependent transferase [Aspergillus oleicola]